MYSSRWQNQWPSFAEWFPNMRSLRMTGKALTLQQIGASKFDRLEELSISVNNYGSGFTLIGATRLLQQLPQLHTLDILALGFTLNQLLNIIKNHRTIRKLKVDMCHYSVIATAFNVQQLINEHPQLIELELMGLGLALDTIDPLISQLNALKHFRFEIDSRAEYDRLVAQLDGQWRSSFSDPNPTSHRLRVVQLER